jgi:glutamyl-tRNA reductase
VAVVVVGLNHRTAPIGVLERLAIREDRMPKALHQLLSYDHVLEGAVLSTCNRIEIYAVVTKYHGGAQDLRNLLAEFCHVAPEDFVDHLYTYHDDGAARHLFRVAAGVDSMVVGESEILGQVRRAYALATEEGAARSLLGHLMRQALRVGKRARAETAISRNPVSVASAAVELARRADPAESLAGKRVLVVGAGRMGSLALQAVVKAGAGDASMTSRTEERAARVAAPQGAATVAPDELESALARSDIVISSTTAPRTVLDRDLVERALARRNAPAPLFIVDIAVPRDVDPAVGELDGVVLRDIDDLRAVVEAGVGSRIGEVSKVEDIVTREVERFVEWQQAGAVAPAVAALVDRAEATRVSELERARPRLEGLTPRQLAAVDRLTKRIVAKLLHPPLDNAGRLANSTQGHLYLQVMRELFELDDDRGS